MMDGLGFRRVGWHCLSSVNTIGLSSGGVELSVRLKNTLKIGLK